MTEREIVKRILAIEREQSRRDALPLRAYNRDKVHVKQMAFHKCDAKNRWVFGGNRTGKTECGAVEAVWLLLGIHPYKPNRPDVEGWSVSVSTQVQRDVAQAKILKYLAPEQIADVVMASGRKDAPEGGVIDYILVRNAFGGVSKLGFRSCDQGREKFQGTSLDFVWFDEEPAEDVYDECRMRVFDRDGYVFGTMTPLKGLDWVYDRIEMNPENDSEIATFRMEWRDNPYLDEEAVNKMIAATPDDLQEARRYGRFCSGQGPVYPEFSPEVHVVEPFDVPEDWQAGISIDPGLNNPTSCHFYAVDFDGNIYAVAEHYEGGKSVDYHSEKISEIADGLGWKRDGKGRLHALIDSAAAQHTLAASKSVAELFAERGILVNTRVNKDLFSGIQTVKSLFRQNKIFVFKNCVNLIRELKGYWWGADDRPKKADDHAVDELRYFVMSRPRPPDVAKSPPEPWQRDKEALIRQRARRGFL